MTHTDIPESDVIESVDIEGSKALRLRLRTMIEEHCGVFTRSVRRDTSMVAQMELETKQTTSARLPLGRVAPPLPDADRTTIQIILNKRLREGVIRPSLCTTGPPIRDITRTGSPRLEINYSELNHATHITGPPMANIAHLLSGIGPHRARLLGIFGLQHGLHPSYQLGIHEPHRHLTAFNTTLGPFEWNRVPHGLKCAHAYWYQQVSIACADFPNHICLVHLGHLIVWGSDETNYLEHLEEVFERLNSRNIALEATTSRLGVTLPWIGTADDVADALVRIILQQGHHSTEPQRQRGGGGRDAASRGSKHKRP